jgi:aldose 1-epimerase
MPVVTIADAATGAMASVLPELGFNCFSFAVPLGGKTVETLWSAPDFAGGKERASGSGIPILFPFPGRIPGTTFEWEGKRYSLEPGDAFGNAIHGFCHTRPWRVIERSASKIIGEFHAGKDDPGLLHRWPSDFCLRATYEVEGNTLKMHYRAENRGNAPLPCGLGVHPYFRLPMGGASANNCIVTLPVTKRWELKQMLPTGQVLEVENASALQRGERFENLQLDDVFAGLPFTDDQCTATIADSEAKIQVAISWDRAWRECVVYTPGNREAICIEPYTCCPGAAVLNPRGIDAGLRVLPPGSAFEAEVSIALSAL